MTSGDGSAGRAIARESGEEREQEQAQTQRQQQPKRLTDYSSCGGCASKLAAGELSRVLGGLPVPHDPRVLVDYRTHDDAGVYKIDEQTAIVQTVDFFTPIVDDPFRYGQIAAANALSDVYAMGGTPLTALAVAAFPATHVSREVIGAVFAGGLSMLREAGVALLGGHTVRDQEIKFGYAVTGTVHPDRIWSNAGARVGDVLLLTKSIGTGIVTTAIKFGRAPQALADTAIASMSTLNRAAAEALASIEGAVGGCTDVTGFSLMGHASEMAAASRVTLRLRLDAIPLFPGVLDLVPGNTTGGGATNRDHFSAGVELSASALEASGAAAENLTALLYDPQTSGGLLVSVDPGLLDPARRALAARGIQAAVVGTVEPRRAAVLVSVA
jgi:selenide, water dikinase